MFLIVFNGVHCVRVPHRNLSNIVTLLPIETMIRTMGGQVPKSTKNFDTKPQSIAISVFGQYSNRDFEYL